MKLKYPINLHKGLTGLVTAGLMIKFSNFTVAAWTYLALHGTYGVMWLLKDRLFPDKAWEQKVSAGYGAFVFVVLGLYWIAPWWLISQHSDPPPAAIAASVALAVLGTFLHFGSDAQKYFTLKYHKGLITEGFFRINRNTNYLGELMIYSGFALLSWHPIGFAGIALFFLGAFLPNMIKKDRSLSRYPEFADYKRRSGFLFPYV